MQRPLWASTSTKNPDYPELLYVDTLIGPHTVNTMPGYAHRLRDHGTLQRTVDQDGEQAQQTLHDIEALGISMQEVTDQLEQEGVQKFIDSYEQLLDSIEQRRARIRRRGIAHASACTPVLAAKPTPSRKLSLLEGVLNTMSQFMGDCHPERSEGSHCYLATGGIAANEVLQFANVRFSMTDVWRACR